MVWTVVVTLLAGMSVGIFGGKLFPDPPQDKHKYLYLVLGILLLLLAAYLASNGI